MQPAAIRPGPAARLAKKLRATLATPANVKLKPVPQGAPTDHARARKPSPEHIRLSTTTRTGQASSNLSESEDVKTTPGTHKTHEHMTTVCLHDTCTGGGPAPASSSPRTPQQRPNADSMLRNQSQNRQRVPARALRLVKLTKALISHSCDPTPAPPAIDACTPIPASQHTPEPPVGTPWLRRAFHFRPWQISGALLLFQIASGVINATASCCPILGGYSLCLYLEPAAGQQPLRYK